RRRHTRCSRDWSSDVCSSDLNGSVRHFAGIMEIDRRIHHGLDKTGANQEVAKPFLLLPPGSPMTNLLIQNLQNLFWRDVLLVQRSEERRAGEECRCPKACAPG